MSETHNTPRLRRLRLELAELKPDLDSQRFNTWRRETSLSLRRAFGERHYLVQEWRGVAQRFALVANRFGPDAQFSTVSRDFKHEFERCRDDTAALLDAALSELAIVDESPDYSAGGSIEAGLAAYVANLVKDGDWVKLPSATVLYVEDTVRRWAQLSPDVKSKDVWVKVLSPKDGRYPLGVTEAERQGWLQFGMGFSLALRNPNSHSLAKREDARAYALGILGAASLLLTQLRFEHGGEIATAEGKPQSHMAAGFIPVDRPPSRDA
jgi:hypothetical protein